uniref:Activator of basal transcription 1 n=1 Tax=Megaselia scalaris TaxID=36166 RepID=T1GAB8_MEGSC
MAIEEKNTDSEMEFEEGEEEEVQDQESDENEEILPKTSELDDGKPRRIKQFKKGIIYVSNLPKHMNVIRIREILGHYGDLGRVFLQPDKLPEKRLARHFTEGWVEFKSKTVAKKVVEMLNNKQISTRKKSQFYDSYWVMKYLHGFKWVHLTERLNYENAVYKQRLRNEVSMARKEANFFQSNLDKSEYLKKQKKKNNKKANKVVNVES